MRLPATIDEKINFETIIGAVTQTNHKEPLKINCSSVTRINSVGVRQWTQYFDQLRKKGIKLKFVECAAPIVEQMSIYTNFIHKDEMESFYLPFYCTRCEAELNKLFDTSSIKQIDPENLSTPCNTCGGKANFDEIPSKYLAAFLEEE